MQGDLVADFETQKLRELTRSLTAVIRSLICFVMKYVFFFTNFYIILQFPGFLSRSLFKYDLARRNYWYHFSKTIVKCKLHNLFDVKNKQNVRFCEG